MHLLLIANDFPNPREPTKGIFNLCLARALALRHKVTVISPVSWLDKWKCGASTTKAPTQTPESVDGVQTYYPRYFYPPKIGRIHYGWFLWQSIRRTVWHVLKSDMPDAVIGYWAHPDGDAAVRVARLIGVPSAVIVGGSDVLLLPQDRRRRRCVVNVLNNTDAILAVSRDLKEHTVKLGIPEGNVHVWSQGVNTSIFAAGSRSEARNRLGIPEAGNVLLWVGRMHPVKAVGVLLQAAAKLEKWGTAFRLYLVGDGPLRPALEAQAQASILRERVCFVGPQDHQQLADWYRAADLTILPSWSEGIPNTLRESLACGTPFVASNVGGIPEIANHPANRLVPPGDSDALARAIEEKLSSGTAAERVVSHTCDWADSAAALVKILQPLVAASQYEDQPWWAGKLPAFINADSTANVLRPRQLLRRAMATVLPHRLLFVRGSRNTNAVSLTFDDGPHPEHTPRLLDVLKTNGVRATFFVVGRQAKRFPDLVRRIAAEGHDVANHSYFHADVNLMSAREATEGILRTQQLLHRTVSSVPALYRPPRGQLTFWKLLRLWWAGMKIVLWNVDPRDYACRTAKELAVWFRRNPLRSGDVVLLHDRLPLAVDVLPELILATRERGLEFVPLTEWTEKAS
jgi:peptidoglycan/xylan/chitin deacetylase (PgdA/CDA1 family)/glycosyltransferase involved in cell wall biosynthesis